MYEVLSLLCPEYSIYIKKSLINPLVHYLLSVNDRLKISNKIGQIDRNAVPCGILLFSETIGTSKGNIVTFIDMTWFSRISEDLKKTLQNFGEVPSKWRTQVDSIRQKHKYKYFN